MIFMDNLESCYWLSSNFQEDDQVKPGEDEQTLFFPGIVARADGIGSYSKPTIQLAAQMAARCRKDILVSFESTNFSSEYIPRLVEQYVNEVPGITVTPPEAVDTTYYRCYTFKRLS